MSGTAQPPLLITVKVAAKLMSMSPAKVYRLIAEQKLPAVHIDTSVRIDPNILSAWIEDKKRGA